MTSTQKVIKYCAIALAMVIIVGIFSAIISGLGALTFIFGSKEAGPMKEYTISQDISKLDIELNATEFEIKMGEKLSFESNCENIKVDDKNGTLKITEPKRFSVTKRGYKAVLYVPYNLSFDSTEISTGAGKVTISALCTDKFDLELGAGEVVLNGVTTYNETDIEGGAGNMSLKDCTFHNLDMNIGVGNCDMTATLIGNNNIDCGVANADFNFVGSKETDYKVKVHKGVGEVSVDGNNVSDGQTIGTGNNYVEIDCGVGSVDIDYIVY